MKNYETRVKSETLDLGIKGSLSLHGNFIFLAMAHISLKQCFEGGNQYGTLGNAKWETSE